MKTKPEKVNIITLGCSKNLVDSEKLLTRLRVNNVDVVHDSNDIDAKTVIINTCGFVNDAKQESIDTILEFVDAKENGLIDNLFVMGCLSERYKDAMTKEIPEVDEYFGVNNLSDILEALKVPYINELHGLRNITTPPHYAYLKISEGCDRKCAFCAIPLIRGEHRSIAPQKLIEEAKHLASNGVKEIILIAQDLTYYGIDLENRSMLNELIEQISEIQGIEWIRLHYAYPTNFPIDVIEQIRKNPKVCKYIDIPFQHISTPILKTMRRGHNKEKIYELISAFRKNIPEIAIRTTLLVGFPDETEQDFNELLQFVKEMKFDRLGVFTYSHEENTHAAINLEDNISNADKQDRADQIMTLQQDISLLLNNKKIGSTIKVIIDRVEDAFYIGRSEFDSPEVDNEVLVSKGSYELKSGDFCEIQITEVDNYDIYGEIVGVNTH